MNVKRYHSNATTLCSSCILIICPRINLIITSRYIGIYQTVIEQYNNSRHLHIPTVVCPGRVFLIFFFGRAVTEITTVADILYMLLRFFGNELAAADQQMSGED